MALGNIGSNATEEFFETILYGTAYAEAQDQIRGITGDVDNALLQDAIQGSMNILAAGAMAVMIQKQEGYINAIFVAVSGFVTTVLADGFGKLKNQLRKFKGVKAFRRMGFASSGMSDRVQLAKLAGDYNSHFMHSVNAKNSATNNSTATMQQKEYMIKKENHQFQVGATKATSYQQTLLFKLFSKNFTAQDQTVVRKILGNSSADMSDVDNLNEVADFMFTKDTAGNITGLSEQMFQLLNGLGYVHK